MPYDAEASPPVELERALAAARSDRAADAALRALRGGTSTLEVTRTAARFLASHYDPASGLAPHALAALGASDRLPAVLEPRHRYLPVLQAINLAAAERKVAVPQPPAAVVSGEVVHLARSALLAFRAGDLADAESVFLGIVDEGWERRMAGETLFRASLEDSGEAGHKLLSSVALWGLARDLGFRDARTLLRPAVQFLVNGRPARKPYAALLDFLGKEWADLEGLAAGGRALDAHGRERLANAVASMTDEACLAAVLELLQDGYAASELAKGIGVEAAKRLFADEGYHPEPVHALLFARAARFVVEFSRSAERVHAVFLAALRIRSPAPPGPASAAEDPADPSAGLEALAEALSLKRPRGAAAQVQLYLARRSKPEPLVSLLGYHACLDSALANQGHNLLLADACLEEYAATRSPEFLIALAKNVAASPKDRTASSAWLSILGG